MGNSIRGNHSRPGTYTKFTDLVYAAKSLGITNAGLVGETIKGPAFEVISVKDFDEYQSIFGGKSAELYKDSLYPRYELPYIAESYLKKSDQLSVCRVLGLSGYNAGPAFVITASNGTGDEKYVIAVLRSRGNYRKYANIGTDCNPVNKYDTLLFDCDEVTLETYSDWSMVINGCDRGISTGSTSDIELNDDNYGQFTVICKKNGTEIGRYPVSLNSGAKEYIYKVLGSKPTDGNAAVFVEELYDLRLRELIEDGTVSVIDKDVVIVDEAKYNVINEPAVDFVKIPYDNLKASMIGKAYLCDVKGIMTPEGTTAITEDNGYIYMKKTTGGTYVETEMAVGGLYTVAYFKEDDGSKSLRYFAVLDEEENEKILTVPTTASTTVDTIKVLSTEEYYQLKLEVVNSEIEGETESVYALHIVGNMSDYHERFRCASTPWIVSEIKGDAQKAEVKKLFRFHTITDGNYANEHVKVTISNVRPDEGRFDVLIRDYNDSDGNMTILESYRNLSMIPGDAKYIALQIGTVDGAYEVKSKYVMLEIIENDMTETCVPCGFLGYPVRDYEPYDNNLNGPTFVYNKYYEESIKPKRQCFGLSDITGIDVDMFLYKGKAAYDEDYTKGHTKPFHLDSTLNKEVSEELGIEVTIDGDESTIGIEWEAVALDQGQQFTKAPIIGTEEAMIGSIYEDKNMRKFTVCFYGGFDGWDIYRNSRTTGDDFKANRYKGTILNGYGETFSKLTNGEGLNLKGNCITSDYYAFLAGAMQYQNPERYTINLFATPGIDYVNNTMLFNEILEMIEERQDTLYIPTTPDKPYGATDDVSEMYTAEEAVENLEDTTIDTFYAATYYPWIKYYDKDNKMYINLPPTKDALRDMADVDNKSYPWMAPAGVNRGNVEGKRLHKYTHIDEEDTLYDGRINALTTFSKEGIKIWGNKTMYTTDSPMNRVNVVRLMLYMRKLIIEASRTLIFDQNDATLKGQFEKIVNGILAQIKKDRGITDYKLVVSQTPEEMDAHELNCKLFVKPTPTLEYIGLEFVVTPQGVNFADL